MTKVVEIAKAEIGNRETGNNDNKYGKWYGANNQPLSIKCLINDLNSFKLKFNTAPEAIPVIPIPNSASFSVVFFHTSLK